MHDGMTRPTESPLPKSDHGPSPPSFESKALASFSGVKLELGQPKLEGPGLVETKEARLEREANTGRFEKVDDSVVEAGNLSITAVGTKDRHKVLLQSICRLCGGLAIKCRPKEHFGEQITRLCGIDPLADNPHVHPRYVCSLCCKKFYYRSSHVREPVIKWLSIPRNPPPGR